MLQMEKSNLLIIKLTNKLLHQINLHIYYAADVSVSELD